MKRIITISLFTILVLTLIALAMNNIFDSFMLFIVAGVIPGTQYALSPNTMFFLATTFMSILIFRITSLDSSYLLIQKYVTKQTKPIKKRLPKRRFGQI